MRILFFASYYHPYLSGITTYPRTLLKQLADFHQIKVLTFKHSLKLKDQEQFEGYRIVRMPFLTKISKGFFSIASIKIFFQEVLTNDLVILNLPNVEGLLLAIFAKVFRKKIIAIFHCQLVFEKGFANKIIGFLANLSIYLQLFLADRAVAYSEDYFNSTLAGKIFNKKFEIALPPISFLPSKNKYQKNNEIWIGYAGRVSREKGLIFLVDAISQLSEKSRIRLVIAGPFGKEVVGEAEYYSQLKNALKKHKIKHSFFGALDKNQLAKFYSSIDLLCLPSTNSTEAFGMVQVEAMLAGKPVIVTDLPGVRTPIWLTGMGLIVPPKNAVELKKAIEQILKNPKQFSMQTQIKKAQTLFNEDKTVNLFMQLITEVSEELTIDCLTEQFVSRRPAFFGLIRPLELKIWLDNQQYLKGNILDFGCGDGFFCELLQKNLHNNLEITGLDIYQSRIEQAFDKKIYKTLKSYDGKRIPFANNQFDVVISNSVLEHSDDLENSLEEIFRVIKPGGYFLCSVMTQAWEDNLVGNKVFGKRYLDWFRKKQVHTNLFNQDGWERKFKKTGFVVDHSYSYLFRSESSCLEIMHYFSVFSLLSKKLFDRWVLWPALVKNSPMTKLIKFINKKAEKNILQEKSQQASALFFILQKPISPNS